MERTDPPMDGADGRYALNMDSQRQPVLLQSVGAGSICLCFFRSPGLGFPLHILFCLLLGAWVCDGEFQARTGVLPFSGGCILWRPVSAASCTPRCRKVVAGCSLLSRPYRLGASATPQSAPCLSVPRATLCISLGSVYPYVSCSVVTFGWGLMECSWFTPLPKGLPRVVHLFRVYGI